jgi:hypothetical protein
MTIVDIENCIDITLLQWDVGRLALRSAASESIAWIKPNTICNHRRGATVSFDKIVYPLHLIVSSQTSPIHPS